MLLVDDRPTRDRGTRRRPGTARGCRRSDRCRRRRAVESISSRSRPRSRPVRMATRMPAAAASGAMVAKCWRARISVGAINAAWRPASITCAAAISATTVLPEPTSPCSSRSMRSRLRQIGDDIGNGALLRRRQRIGQRRDDARAQPALGRSAAAGARAHMRAQQRERELAGQQFVISEPRPGRAFRRDVLGRRRTVNAAQRLGKTRIVRCACKPCRVLPLRQLRQPLERGVDRLADLVRMQPFGQRIDRIDQRQFGKACRIDHAVGMQHLQMAVVEASRCRRRSAASPSGRSFSR